MGAGATVITPSVESVPLHGLEQQERLVRPVILFPPHSSYLLHSFPPIDLFHSIFHSITYFNPASIYPSLYPFQQPYYMRTRFTQWIPLPGIKQVTLPLFPVISPDSYFLFVSIPREHSRSYANLSALTPVVEILALRQSILSKSSVSVW